MKLSSLVKEIPITEMQGLRIGNAQDFEAMTGVTVLIFDEGAKVGTDISGGGVERDSSDFPDHGGQSDQCDCAVGRLCIWSLCKRRSHAVSRGA